MRAVEQNEVWRLSALALLGSLAFVNLMALPAFEDEGSQLRLIFRSIEAQEWLQPLGEGKPLEAWPMVLFVRLDFPLLAAIRALHVLVGIIGAFLTYRLAALLTNRWTAFTAGALFAICPYVVYLQRLALSDIFTCTAGVWVMVRALKLLHRPSWPRAAGLAAALMLAAFCKFPVGFVYLMAVPLALLLMNARERHALLQRPAVGKLAAAYAPAGLLALLVIVVAVIRWRSGRAPGFGVQDLLGIGAGSYPINLPRPSVVGELATQLSWPVVVISSIGIAASALAADWRQRWLIWMAAAPMSAIGVFASFWYPRYLLIFLPPLIVAAVCGWLSLSLRAGMFRRPCQIGILAICVGFMAWQSALLIFDPLAAKWSPLDRYQYFEGPGSGYGYPEAARFILAAADAPSMIYSLDGHSAYQLRTYLPPQWRARVTSVFFGEEGRVLRNEDERLEHLLSRTPAWLIVPEPLLRGYLIASFGEKNADQFALRERAVFDKPGLRTRLVIYEVTPRHVAAVADAITD